jgi:hypothetical protein
VKRKLALFAANQSPAYIANITGNDRSGIGDWKRDCVPA